MMDLTTIDLRKALRRRAQRPSDYREDELVAYLNRNPEMDRTDANISRLANLYF